MSKPCLLDVNALAGLLWNVHSLHGRSHSWFARESPLVLGCAFTELSFVRVSMADKTIAASFTDAETALAQFTASLANRYRFIDRLPPASLLRGLPVRSHKETTISASWRRPTARASPRSTPASSTRPLG